MYTPCGSRLHANFASMKDKNILVTGAAGQSGTLIVRALAAKQQPVRALVRDTEKAKSLGAIPGVALVAGNMLEKDTLKAALDGVHRVMLISSANHRMVETQCTFIDACKEAGVHHVIKFSGEESQQGYDPQRFRFTREHEQIEDYLESSGMQWTHLRPSQFMQVYLREAPAIHRTSELRLPLKQIRMSPVDLRDVARVAAAILMEGGHTDRSLRITGPESLSMDDIATILSRTAGKTIRYVPVTWDERAAALSAAGLPDYFLDALEEQTAERVRNPEAIVDTSTHRLFGVPPTTFSKFSMDHTTIFNQS